MLLLSTLLTALARKTGDFLQALFGWSVAALFGRLHRSQRISVTIALVLSLFWPVFVVGTFFPAAATWFIAFVPIESPTAKSVLRGVWLILALTSPAVVGALVRSVVPLGARKSTAASMLHGYPLALGMALSFLVTLITVPLVKLSSIARRWEEEHIYVQPREGRYRDVLKHLVTACEASQLIPTVERVPFALALSTRVLRFFSRGAIDTLLVLEPRRVVCEGLELSLYPADLLLRGTPDRVAHVRARLTATLLERDAYLVQDPKAQELQDELGRLWDTLQRHAFHAQAVAGLEARLEATVRTAISARSIPFDEWLTIDRIARRFEAELHGQRSRIDAMAGEALVAAHTLPAAANHVAVHAEHLGVVSLLSSLAHESRELVQLEAELAKEEALETMGATVRSVVSFSGTIACAGAALSLLGVALVLASGSTVTSALLIAGALVLISAGLAAVGWSSLPTSPMSRTRKRLETDWKLLRERAT